MQSDQSKRWLVKSGERILGPFSQDEVISKIRNREFAVIDEVELPMSRWRLIRDEPGFKEIVEEIRRGLMATRDDTEIQGHTMTMTMTNLTQTKTDPDVVIDAPATPPVRVEPERREEKASSKRVVVPITPVEPPIDQSQVVDAEFSEEKPELPIHDQAKIERQFRQYGVGPETSRRKSPVVKFVWMMAGVVLVAAAWLIIRSQTSPEPGGNGDFVRVAADAERAWQQGDFMRSLAAYRLANRLRPSNPQVVARLAPLLIRFETQTVPAKRMLIDSIDKLPASTDVKTRALLEVGLGLASLASEDFADAEAQFRSALTSVPGMFSARFNLAMTSYLSKSFDQASDRFGEAGDDPLALYMKARSLIASDKGSKTTARHDAEAAIFRAIGSSNDYRQEMLVTSAALKNELGNKKGALGEVQLALSTDPDMTNDHWHDPILYIEPLSWREMTGQCRRLNEDLKAPSARALLALCLYKSGEREEASRMIGEGLAQWPEEPILEAVSAYILSSTGRYSDARASLRLAFARTEDVPALALLVRARLCMQSEDMACAAQSWQQLSEQVPPFLSALAGLAEIRFRQGDQAQAMSLIAKAKALSPRYRPIIALEESVALK